MKGKDEVFQLRISEDDRRRMELLSQRFGVSRAGVIRMLLRQSVSEEELVEDTSDEEEDAALGHHAAQILDDVRKGKEKAVPLSEVEAELIAAGVLDA